MKKPSPGGRERAEAPMVFVMAGLVPAIHVFLGWSTKDVDARHKAGPDD
jgi:hypothetical protein